MTGKLIATLTGEILNFVVFPFFFEAEYFFAFNNFGIFCSTVCYKKVEFCILANSSGLEEVAWPGGWSTGFEICRLQVQVLF